MLSKLLFSVLILAFANMDLQASDVFFWNRNKHLKPIGFIQFKEKKPTGCHHLVVDPIQPTRIKVIESGEYKISLAVNIKNITETEITGRLWLNVVRDERAVIKVIIAKGRIPSEEISHINSHIIKNLYKGDEIFVFNGSTVDPILLIPLAPIELTPIGKGDAIRMTFKRLGDPDITRE